MKSYSDGGHTAVFLRKTGGSDNNGGQQRRVRYTFNISGRERVLVLRFIMGCCAAGNLVPARDVDG